MEARLIQQRRLLFYTLYLAYISVGIISILPGPTLPLLAAHTGVSLDVAGWAFTSSATGFMMGVILTGIISTRVGPKYILMMGLALLAMAGIATAQTHLFAFLLFAQFVQGVGFGLLDVSINMTVTLVFADTLTETLNNLHSAYGFGALIAPLLLSFALEITNDAFLAYLAGSLLGATGILLLLRQPIPAATKQISTLPQQSTTTASRILRQSLLWLMALQLGLYVGAEVGFGNWIVTGVSMSAAISLALAAPCATFLWLGLTVGRLAGAQVVKRSIFSETALLYIAIVGSGVSGLIVAAFPGQIAISFPASGFVGFFFGPIFPGVMAIASRWFVHTLGTVSSVLLISAGVVAMILPVLMGFLIAPLGISRVLAIPALVSLAIIIPLSIALRQQRKILQRNGQRIEPVRT
ncbi:MAG: multidrug effflux MFS transporter [Ktedonobacteraceae bacterium]